VAPDVWPVLTGDKNTQSVGGAEVQQTLLAKGFARRGYPVSIISRDFGQPDQVTVENIRVVKGASYSGRLPIVRFFHPRLTGLWAALKAVNAQIYYQRTPGAATGVTGLFAKRYGRRFVYAAACDLDLAANETARLFQRGAGWRDLQLYRLGLKLADAIVAQHPRQVADCEYWYGKAATLVPSCYDAPADRCASADGDVLWVSILRPGKRPELFLELARRLPYRRFRMVGGPSTEAGGDAFFAHIRESAAAIPNLEFVGFVPFADIDAQFNSARVFVNTSDYEGFPNTFLQSWSRAIPTVSFCNTGSTMNGEPVVNVATDLDEMTTMVEKLMQDDRHWSATGRRARRCYEQCHTPDAAMNVYERLVATQWKAMEEMRRSAA
jgi:glycosyltransferase involved in cell wall biosynthesis